MIKICCVCEKDGAPYKCPTCQRPYCSVVCCKQHKTQTCVPPEAADEDAKQSSTNETQYDFPTEDTVPIEKLQQLHHSEELKQCLRNPHVRDIMQAVLNDRNPAAAIASAMTEPIFVEMADACLKVVEPPEDESHE